MSESRTENKRHTLAHPIRSPMGDTFRKDRQILPPADFIQAYESTPEFLQHLDNKVTNIFYL